MKPQANIFYFLDFREYLKRRFRKRRAEKNKKDARRKQWSYLRLIIDGRIHLNPRLSDKLAKNLELAPLEARYFQTLVQVSQSSHSGYRKRLKRLRELYRSLKTTKTSEIVLYMDSI